MWTTHEPICRLSSSPLTSVDVNAARIGYEAAALLDRMIAGEKRPRQVIELPPRGVVARPSTDLLAVDDLHVAAALRFIREHVCDPINVEQVLSQIPISRSTLERRFQATAEPNLEGGDPPGATGSGEAVVERLGPAADGR